MFCSKIYDKITSAYCNRDATIPEEVTRNQVINLKIYKSRDMY